MEKSCILFESPDKSVVLVDIPRSIEEAQVLPGKAIDRRLVSSSPVEKPWGTPEPRNDDGCTAHSSTSPSAAIAELMTLETVRAALDKVRSSGYGGPWCLPRVVAKERAGCNAREEGKEDSQKVTSLESKEAGDVGDTLSYQGGKQTSSETNAGKNLLPPPSSAPFIPEQSHYLHGSIASQRSAFLQTAPLFDLIVLDPPWPSRSAKRKRKNRDGGGGSYATAYGMREARDLLAQIPIATRLKPDGGLVAIWITNKAAVADLVLNEVFPQQWGLEPFGEWTWVKITSSAGGEPVVDLEARWRKPWERLLIARRKGSTAKLPSGYNGINKSKVILAVPDVHSRKPNLRALFKDILPDGYVGLEVFARNLTAGWWSWGDEVLRFQQRDHWIQS